MRDLEVVTADKDAEFALRGILLRPQALNLRAVDVQFHVHPEKDSGCYVRGERLLAPFRRQCQHALLVFDREGCGAEQLTYQEIQSELQSRFQKLGWQDWADVVVIDPELENWVWSDSPEVDQVLGWNMPLLPLREWLAQESFLGLNDPKPPRPKEAFDAVLRKLGKRHSSAIFRELGSRVSVRRCVDPSFIYLRDTLQRWFAK